MSIVRFSVLPTMMFLPVLLCLIIVFFVARARRESSYYNKTVNAPVLTVEARIVSKRSSVGGYGYYGGRSGMTGDRTLYFATFEVESGDRMEFEISGSEYGLLAEGDNGKLTFQGSGFMSFRRNMPEPPPIDYRGNK